MTGQRFGRLVALYSKSFNSRLKWLCQCDCGNQVWINTGALRNGGTKSCGCLHNEFKNLIGQKFGKLTVISLNGERTKNGRYYWNCICECGNITVVSTSNLTNKNPNKKVISCGCYKRQLTSERFSAKLEGKRFGRLTVVKRIGTQIQENGDQKSFWLCKCDCGTMVQVIGKNLLNGNTKSCGCLESNGEEETGRALESKHIKYKKEYIFKDLLGPNGGYLRFDFAIFNFDNSLNCLIEFQGPQHDPAKAERYGEFGKQQREVTDKQKREYCFAHDIPLFEIWDTSEIDEVLDKISKNLK